jgi:hypothetical protein
LTGSHTDCHGDFDWARRVPEVLDQPPAEPIGACGHAQELHGDAEQLLPAGGANRRQLLVDEGPFRGRGAAPEFDVLHRVHEGVPLGVAAGLGWHRV